MQCISGTSEVEPFTLAPFWNAKTKCKEQVIVMQMNVWIGSFKHSALGSDHMMVW